MQLSDFVSETLMQIEKGVKEARNASHGNWIALGTVGDKPVWNQEKVSFDIALTTTTEGSGGISVLGIGKAGVGQSYESANRVSFSIPVFFNSIVYKGDTK